MRFDRLMEQLVGIFALVVPGSALAFGFLGVFMGPALLAVAHGVWRDRALVEPVPAGALPYSERSYQHEYA